MKKKAFKAESKRLLDLMINSIYTHKEIFLREIISNASDAIDKLCYLSLTDDKVGLNRDQFEIKLSIDKEHRLLTVSDNGIGMSQEELENNLGVIASSGSLKFRQEVEGDESADTDIIGQFGVGFYSAFMVADCVRVESRAFGADEAFCWSLTVRRATRWSPARKRATAPASSCTSSRTRTTRTMTNFWSPTGCRPWSRSIPITSATPSKWRWSAAA